MITEDDLTRLLTDAAGAFPEPELPTLEVPVTRPLHRRRGVQLLAAAAALLVGALVVSSLGGGAAAKRTETVAVAGTAAAPVPAPSAAAGFASSGGDLVKSPPAASNGGQNVADAPVTAPVEALTPTGRTSAVGAAPAPAAPEVTAPDTRDGARVVKTGKVSLVVDDGKVSTTVSRVTAVAAAQRGYVSDSSTQEYGDSPSASVTLRVPVAAFESVVQGVRGLGAHVASSEVSGTDVTAEYADTEAQIRSLTAARERFLAILAGAKTIGETLTVQQRVDDVQGRIDRLEGQRRVLASQSDLATLTVTVAEKDDEKLVKAAPSGFGKAWDDAKHGFSSGVEGLVARSGRALLVGLVAVVAFLVLRLGWRLARRRLV